MSEIKEFFQNLVKAGTIPQEPMSYDAATLKIYIDHLEAENVALRERLGKAVELPATVMIERTLVDGKFKDTQKAQAFNGRIGVVYRDETRWKGLLVDICSERTGDYKAAESRLAELKGETK